MGKGPEAISLQGLFLIFLVEEKMQFVVFLSYLFDGRHPSLLTRGGIGRE